MFCLRSSEICEIVLRRGFGKSMLSATDQIDLKERTQQVRPNSEFTPALDELWIAQINEQAKDSLHVLLQDDFNKIKIPEGFS